MPILVRCSRCETPSFACSDETLSVKLIRCLPTALSPLGPKSSKYSSSSFEDITDFLFHQACRSYCLMMMLQRKTTLYLKTGFQVVMDRLLPRVSSFLRRRIKPPSFLSIRSY
ncbi:hypothetical protein TIFTF001_027244 [Ficus carica]|uniref:Uncharacterized protein n=1 Tax=Ficus carica TaxID=3494 RepID=A0AA88IZY7_FICCA|nr:hypothetical protein TIFTF001_027244 [Ficus carica]